MPTLGPSAISGACAGLVSSIVTCPLDVVKTKLQAQTTKGKGKAVSAASNAGHGAVGQVGRAGLTPQAAAAAGPEDRVYKGLIGTLRTIYRDNGIRGFYRGLGPTIFGYLPTWAIYFTVYDGCKEFLADRGARNDRGEEDFFNHVLSAMTAGAASTVCTSPLWVVKTRFMLQSAKPQSPSEPAPYKHTLDAFVRIMRTEGPLGFYRGLLPSLMGVSHVAVQFPLYESFKSLARDSPLALEAPIGTPSAERELPPQIILLCSSTAKMIASVLTYPHEVVRTRLQMQPRGKPDITTGAAAAAASAYAPAQSPQVAGQNSAESRRSYSTASTRRGVMLASQAARAKALPALALDERQAAQRATLFHHSRTVASEQGPALKYTGVIRTVRTIFVEEGLRGFYNGMGVNLVRTVPSSALTILTYEVMMGHLTRTNSAPDAHATGGDQWQSSETRSETSG